MGNKIGQIDANKKMLIVDGKVYEITPRLDALIMLKHPRPTQYNSNDDKVFKSLVAQTKVKSFANRTSAARPHATWKWKHMLKKMVKPNEKIAEGEESEDTDDTDNVLDNASIGDIGESSDISTPGSSVPSPYSLLWKS